MRRGGVSRMVVAAAIISTGSALWIPSGCNTGFMPVATAGCAEENENAPGINIAGVHRYSGTGINGESGPTFQLSGTITFEQQGTMVRVTDTTYDNTFLRPLQSEFAEFTGNRLGLLLTPKNGDDDYRAAVKFVFSETGDQFCVQFADTNDDNGGFGSFVGRRISTE